MRAISVMQPWATLIVCGCKHLETRPWTTSHRGPLVIHASKSFPAAAKALCRIEPFRSLLAGVGCLDWRDLPAGQLLGVVEVIGCRRVEELANLAEVERQLGDFGPGRWAWALAGARALPVPVPCRGRLGLYDVADDLLGLAVHAAPPA